MADYIIQGDTLDAIAEAINQKAGTQAAMTPAQMVTAINALPSGGGGLDDYFTPVNCVTIRNNATYGNSNDFIMSDTTWNVVKKIEIRFKLANPSAAHFIWATADTAQRQPFIDKTTASSGGTTSVITNETVDGITHYVLSLNSTSIGRFRIGSWNDATYSQTAAYYELKMWDANDNLIVDLQPSVSVNGNLPSFLNKISGIFYTPTSSFIAGEVLS